MKKDKKNEPAAETQVVNKVGKDMGGRAVRVACLTAALEMRSVATPNQTVLKNAMEFEQYVLGEHRLQRGPEAPEGAADDAPEDH